jgi:PKHD-type hydroxylase
MLLALELLTADELRQAQRLLAEAPWEEGTKTAGSQARSVKRNRQIVAGSAAERALQALVLGALERSPAFLSAALPRRVLPPRFNRYGGELNTYGEHVDQAVRYHEGQALRTDVSATLFLSEGYEGGDLVVRHSFGEERVKLPAGSLILYPSGSLHRVEPVTQGERLAAFFFIESLVPDTEQRRLLHELDQTLIALRSRDGDSAESVALMGTYHNLLRMWTR